MGIRPGPFDRLSVPVGPPALSVSETPTYGWRLVTMGGRESDFAGPSGGPLRLDFDPNIEQL